MTLSPEETDLIGNWRTVGDRVEADETARRIEQLTRTQLTRLGFDESGWDTLFQDPRDGRFWELTYPSSGSEGGGPPRLTCLDVVTAQVKYGSIVAGPRSLAGRR